MYTLLGGQYSRYASAGLFSCPSDPITKAGAMDQMKDWQNGIVNTAALGYGVQYCYWNGEYNMDPSSNQMEYPQIYTDGDVTNGEYPIRVGQKNASTICILGDYFGGNGVQVRRQGYARHKDKEGYGIGGNHVYLDGHAVWKPWQEMYTTGANSYWWGGSE